MPVHFEEDPDGFGFDDSEGKNYSWLVVPVRDTRTVWLRESTGYDYLDYEPTLISVSPPKLPPGSDRLIRVTANVSFSRDTHLDVSKKKGGEGPSLGIRILASQRVKVAFFEVTDTAHASGRPWSFHSTQLIRDANDILLPQTNVQLVNANQSPTPVAFNRDLGRTVDGNKLRHELEEVAKPTAGRADLAAFFVWDLARSPEGLFFRKEPEHPAFVIMKEPSGDTGGQALAHEVGHYLLPGDEWKGLGLDQSGHSPAVGPEQNQYPYLMCPFVESGTKITYKQAGVMNLTAGQP
jgi:hypothetical protein